MSDTPKKKPELSDKERDPGEDFGLAMGMVGAIGGSFVGVAVALAAYSYGLGLIAVTLIGLGIAIFGCWGGRAVAAAMKRSGGGFESLPEPFQSGLYAFLNVVVAAQYILMRYPGRVAIGAGVVLLVLFGARHFLWPVSEEQRERFAKQIAALESGRRRSIVRLDPGFVGQLVANEKAAANVQSVYFFAEDLSDRRYSRLRNLPKLQQILLYNTEDTDAFVQRLAGMPIESFTFSDTDLTPRGAKSLASYPNLKSLHFSPVEVQRAGLEEVGNIAQLERLNLTGTEVTDEQLQHLKKLGALKTIGLRNTLVTDLGLQHLKGLADLETLSLRGTPITDASLTSLQQLPALKALSLEDTPITDKGLKHLQKLTSLRELYLYGTKVTQEGVGKLQENLRNCQIERRWLLSPEEFLARFGYEPSNKPRKKPMKVDDEDTGHGGVE